jgi:ribokinase
VDTAPVVVVGSVNLDTTLEVERLPEAGATVLARTARTAVGGKGANQAVAVARQGVPTAFVGVVGPDPVGRQLLDALIDEGVDVTATRIAPDGPSGQALITVDAAGANTIVVASGANSLLTNDDAAMAGRGAVVLTQLEIPLPVVRAALSAGRDRGAVTVLNPAPAAGPLDAGLLALCDLIVPNEVEAVALTGRASPEDAAAALAAMSEGATVVVTCGARGAVVWCDGEVRAVAAFPVRPVDTVAAGDAFCGALAASIALAVPAGADVGDPALHGQLTRGPALDAALRRASAAGALSALVRGALPSLPTRVQVDEFLAAKSS